MTLIDNRTRFIVQGVTGNAAQWHLKEMLDLGQPVLAGVQPGGPREPVHGVPVFQSVAAACEAIGEPPDASLIFVPAAYAVDAAHEAIASRIPLLIWIAEGVYTPESANATVLVMLDEVEIYGGFTGTELSLAERPDPILLPSTLNGDFNGDDIPGDLGTNRADNSYHVVEGASDARLDGFTLTGGNATNGPPNHFGGGITAVRLTLE